MLAIPAAPAVRKLADEIKRIHGELDAADAALQAAREAAAVPRPAAQKIGPGELETARLSDLAGLTSGRVAELEATKAAEARALAEWKGANAVALAEIERQEAAVQFHTEALKEARRLEMAAMSAAAQALHEQAAQAYAHALELAQAAAVDLEAMRAIANGASRQRFYDELGMGDLGCIEIRCEQFSVPALGVLNSHGKPARPGDTVKTLAIVSADELHRAATHRADEIMNTMKGRTQ